MFRRGIAVACVAVAALVAAPAAAQAVTPNPFYGVVGTHFPTQAELDQVAAAGGGTFRVKIDWRFIAPEPTVRQFYWTDVLFAEGARAGVTILPEFADAPRWISRRRSRPPVATAAQRSAWSSLMTAFASRYGTNGTLWTQYPDLPRHPITTWEIWNEPNLGLSVGGRPSPRRFVSLLKLSSAALKAGDPGARVLVGGLFPYHTVRNTVGLRRYLNAMYRVPGAAQSFDALGVHPYSSQPSGVLRWVQVTRNIMRRHGDGAKPIWVSAFGWVTGGALKRVARLFVTPRKQARKLTQAYALLGGNASRLGIESALWFTFTDGAIGKHRAFLSDRAGLFSRNGKPKPSWFAFARAAGGTP
jgi:hypothetical protein